MDEQKIKWIQRSKAREVNDIINEYRNPLSFQIEFSNLLNELALTKKYVSSIELGCDTGITSMLLNNIKEKTFLDYNDEAIHASKIACQELKIKGTFITADMFNTHLDSNKFDIVFNAGVIEHYNFLDRTKAIKEYARILKENGTMVIAFPNHYSIPYRFAYILGNFILPKRFKWSTPLEEKIFDLKEEIKTNNLNLIERKVIAKDDIFNYWNFFKPAKHLFKLIDNIFANGN